MKPKSILALVIVPITLLVGSCSKNSDSPTQPSPPSPLEKRADSLNNYVLERHFIPVDFYSSQPIDYNQDDIAIDLNTDLKPFILPYLADDTIIFIDNGTLNIDQGSILYSVFPKQFTMPWKIETSKAKNEVYLLYLNYTYESRRYILDYYNDSEMLAHVPWVSKINSIDTATLYTLFKKK